MVLIVEDDERNRKLVRDVLRARGYRTVETERGEEALDLARAHRPALVLMDINLPGIDGVEALGRLRGDPETAGIPVVAVTASVMTQDQRRLGLAGFDAWLAKPLAIRGFLETVRRVLDAGAGAGPSPA
jgi:two-component system cell cycle response regulator DivK